MSAIARPAVVLDALVGRRSSPAFDYLVLAALAAYIVLFLAVGRAANACFFVLVLLALPHLAQQRAAFAAAWRLAGSRMLVAALASIFVATMAAKLLRGEFDYVDLDSPARFLLAGLLLLFLTAKGIRFVRVFVVAVPLALLAALAAALLNPETVARWDSRFATSFVDPNTLGSYAVILTFMTLLTIDAPGHNTSWWRGFACAGVIAGLLLAMFAKSRGGWAAALPLAALWLLFRWERGIARQAWQGLVVLAVVALVLIVIPDILDRGLRSVGELRGWLDGSNPVTSVGHRLNIWKLCLELYAASPVVGHGWASLAAQLGRFEFATSASPEIVHILIYGGPHSDLLMMALNSGIFGIAGFAALLFVPGAFFWRRRASATGEARLACELGVCLAAGVFVCGLSNEMLSLKYLVSFYGLTVAGLAAQVLGDDRVAGNL